MNRPDDHHLSMLRSLAHEWRNGDHETPESIAAHEACADQLEDLLSRIELGPTDDDYGTLFRAADLRGNVGCSRHFRSPDAYCDRCKDAHERAVQA